MADSAYKNYTGKLNTLFDLDLNPDNINQGYTDWAGQYDKDLLDIDYNGHTLCAKYLNKHTKCLLIHRHELLSVTVSTFPLHIYLRRLLYT